MHLRYGLLLIYYLLFNCSFAQSTPSPGVDMFSQQLEDIAQQTQQEEPDYSSISESFMHYRKHPINLNNTTEAELQNLYLLSGLQINNLLSHIRKNGKLLMIIELQAIEGFDQNLIQKILPYVYAGDVQTIFSNQTSFIQTEQSLLFRYSQFLEKQLGFRAIDKASLPKKPNSRYVGSPQKLFVRYQIRLPPFISAGFTAEKDAGEAFLKKNIPDKFQDKTQNGFDFYSGHLFIQHIKCIQKLILGDYSLSFGQGLTAWNGSSFGKSTVILYAKKTAQGIRPYTSTDENKFMRGIATTLQQRKFFFTAFYSHKAVDATITDTLKDGTPAAVSSLQQTGLHTTPAELKNKHSVQQTVFGGNLSYHSNRFHIGITGMHDFLNIPLKPSQRTDNIKNAGTTTNTNFGLDYNIVFQNFNFFGEGTRNKNGAFAFLNGVFISLHPGITFTSVHRYYSASYQNPMNSGFAESVGSNEKGLYTGITIQLPHSVTWTVCYDRFEFPWLHYLVDGPSGGNDFNTQLSYAPSGKLNMVFRASQRNKQQNTGKDIALKYLIQTSYTDCRYTITYSITPWLKLSNRLELVNFKAETSTPNGYLLYQDARYTMTGKPLSITLRYALFQTDGYDARIYAYEQDVSGAFAIPAYYGKGTRFFILFNYTFNKHLELWLRYSQTCYADKELINAGTLSEIQGNKKSEVKVQVKVSW